MGNRAHEAGQFIGEFESAMRAEWSAGGPTNEDHAGWAYLGVRAFAARTGQYETASELSDSECWMEVVGDFIGDLAHLADVHGQSLEAAIEKGMGMYLEEVEEVKSESK